MAERRPPDALQPLWGLAGFALGAATALISERRRWPTDAVETEIDRHYSDGWRAGVRTRNWPRISPTSGGSGTPRHGRDMAEPIAYMLSATIRGFCRVAIELSKRI
jgi:ubiquinone biosynthesis monooxygenase Coq7